MSKVLLVCEDSTLASAINYFLNKFNLEVVICHDGLAATELIDKNDFDFIITEVLLNFYTGFEVIKEFTKKSSMNRVFILAAFDNYTFMKQSLNSEEFKYILKPYDLRELLNFIQNT